MPSAAQLKAISESRLLEAKALNAEGLYDGAHYIVGYAVETALKAHICKILQTDYPSGSIKASFMTHDLSDLVKLSGLKSRFDVLMDTVPEFKANWSLIKWTEQYRYEPIGTISQQAMVEVFEALEEPVNGILTWIKTSW